MACSKKKKIDIRPFQSSWTTDYGFILKNDRTFCALCLETVVTRTSSVKRHFETKHKGSFKCEAEKNESIKNAVTRYEKQTNVFVNVIGRKNQATEASYKISQCIANFGKPFTDGDYIKEIFLKCSEVLFDDLPNKNIIISRIKEMPTSARTVERRITEMGKNINEQHTDALRNASVLSVALDESVDINGIPRLAIVTRHSDTEMREKLCCLESMHGNTTGKDISKTFIDHFEERGIDIKKIFAVTTDGAPAMENQQDTTEYASGVEDKQQWLDSATHSPIGDAERANPSLPYKRLKLEHRLSSVKNAINNITNQPEENEFDIYGLYVSTCLRKLPLPRAFRLQEKMNSLIVEERISYYSTQSSSTSNEMNARNHMSDNDQLVEGSSHVTNEDVLEISGVKAEAVEIECEPEFTL